MMILQLISVYVEFFFICHCLFIEVIFSIAAQPAYEGNSTGNSGIAFLRRNCPCQHGGTCILGSFCDCPVGFRGRYCEEVVQNRPCGAMAHDTEKLDFTGSCQLCRCLDGMIVCDDVYTCDDLTDYASLRSIQVSKSSKDISLTISNGDDKRSSASQNMVIVFPHTDSVSDSSGSKIEIYRSWIILILYILSTYLFLT